MTRTVTWDRGVALPDHAIWFDPEVTRALAVVTHAHADHARRHQVSILTEETLTLSHARRRPKSARTVAYGEPVKVATGTVTLLPAGHMLGSAQVLFEDSGARLLYTGDLKLRGPRPVTVPPVDILVIESTYGRPHFHFPEHGAVMEDLGRWCRLMLASDVTPVLLCHAIGKSQEVMLGLAEYGFRFALEARCVGAARAYESAGETLPDWIPLDPAAGYEGRVVIAPPAGKEEVRKLHRYRCALVSGWAQDAHFRRLFGADVAFPLSDHCDFLELLDTVERAAPEQVYTVHGFTEDLARHLRRRGVRASALRGVEQLALLL